MIPKNTIEKQFESLVDYLKLATRMVRKIFTPGAFNYLFWCSTYKGIYRLIPLKPVYFSDIQKGEFVFPDGIYPIVEINHYVNLAEYIKTGGKKKLKEEVYLDVILGPELKRIAIFDDGIDKSFIKNWEKIFREKISLWSSDGIFFLIAKNGTLEIRDFSQNNDNDRIKFGIDLIFQGEENVLKRYFLSALFSDLIINFLWNNYEDDRDKILAGIKKLVDNLWTDEMFKARREFLYLNSINLQEKTTLLKAFQKKKVLLDKIRENPDKINKYLISPSEKKYVLVFEEMLKYDYKLPPGVYLITEYHSYNIFTKLPIRSQFRNYYIRGEKSVSGLVLRDIDNEEWLIFGVPPELIEYYQEIIGVRNGEKWRIWVVFSWPTSYQYTKFLNYITLLYIDVPFNPYVEQKGILYIPDEISELLLDNILKLEPPIQRWIEKQAMEDKKELYKKLEDLLNELKTGNLRDETIKKFDETGENDRNKRIQIENRSGDNVFSFWAELIKDIQTEDIMEELEDADIETKVRSKVKLKLPEDVLEELVDDKPKKEKTTKRKKTKKSKKKKGD
jgi:hypothetical protein